MRRRYLAALAGAAGLGLAVSGLAAVSAAAGQRSVPTVVSIADHVDERGITYQVATMSDGSYFEYGSYQIDNITPEMSPDEFVRTTTEFTPVAGG